MLIAVIWLLIIIAVLGLLYAYATEAPGEQRPSEPGEQAVPRAGTWNGAVSRGRRQARWGDH